MAATSGDGSGKTGSPALARLIRERRERLGMSRQELAEATGVPYPTVAQIETAYRGVSPSRLGVFAQALGLDVTNLFAALAGDSPEPTTGRRPRARRSAPGEWMPNPAFAGAEVNALMPPPPERPTGPAVERAIELIASLPWDERLDALAEVQRRVVDCLVAEEVQRRSGKGRR